MAKISSQLLRQIRFIAVAFALAFAVALVAPQPVSAQRAAADRRHQRAATAQ